MDPEPLETKLFCGARAGDVISYFGSGAEFIFLINILLHCSQCGGCQDELNHRTDTERNISYGTTTVLLKYSFYVVNAICVGLELEPEPKLDKRRNRKYSWSHN